MSGHLGLIDEHLTEVSSVGLPATRSAAIGGAGAVVSPPAQVDIPFDHEDDDLADDEVDVLGAEAPGRLAAAAAAVPAAAAAVPAAALGFLGGVFGAFGAAKLLAVRAASEMVDPNSTLRVGLNAVGHAAQTAARSVHHEVTNENSELRMNILPVVKATAIAAASHVATATRAVVHEVSDPTSTLRTRILPGARAGAAGVVHEVADPTSAFRTGFVAPAVHEITDPTSKLRSHVIPAAIAATTAVAHSVKSEIMDPTSHTRSSIAAVTNQVTHQVTDETSQLRAHVLPTIINDFTNPESALRTKTVETVAGAVATGVAVGATVGKACLIATGDVVGKGLRVASTAASTSLGAAGEALHVSPETHARVGQAAAAAHGAVVMSGVVVAGVSAVVAGLGASASAAIRSTVAGEYLETTAGGRALIGAGTATAAAVGEVWSGAVEGVVLLSAHTTVAATEFVGVRYGAEAAAVTLQGAAVIGDVGRIAANACLISPFALAGQAAGAAVHTTADQVDAPPPLPPAMVHDTQVE